jgi:thioredoxin 1
MRALGDGPGPISEPCSGNVRRGPSDFGGIRLQADFLGEKMASEKLQIFTDGNFNQTVVKSDKPVLVDFWAEWCGPCRRLAPTVDALASDYDGRVTVGKLNVDENPNTAAMFSIRGIPTILIFKGGEIVESIVGLADKDHLKQLIDKHV